jgi:hypothetical protein
MPTTTDTTRSNLIAGDQSADVEAAIDSVLRAQGTRLSNYMPSTQAKIREAMASVLVGARATAVAEYSTGNKRWPREEDDENNEEGA